jgi:hypothetical protein
MKRKLMAAAGILTVVLGFIWLLWPVGHIPPYDANLVRLAETQRQGYCSGDAFFKSGGEGSASKAADCRATSTLPDVPNMPIVQTAFCQAIVDNGWEGQLADCLGIMDMNQYWPTYDGYISQDWNRARPYPQSFGTSSGSSKGSGSRTGGHGGSDRTNSPTHEVPYSYPGGTP